MGRELRHARTVDAEFVIQESNFLLGAVVFGFQSHTGALVQRFPASRIFDRNP